MVFGTDEFLEANPISPELMHEAWQAYQGKTNYIATELIYSPNEFINLSRAEWGLLMEPNITSDEEFEELKFMLACFVLVITGKRI